MKKLTLLFIYFTLSIPILSQNKIDDQTSAIVTEGKQLYRSELASWYGTDLFFEKLNDKKLKLLAIFPIPKKVSQSVYFFQLMSRQKYLPPFLLIALTILKQPSLMALKEHFQTPKLIYTR